MSFLHRVEFLSLVAKPFNLSQETVDSQEIEFGLL